ncbi:protein kinase domain-containing protein [Caulobacter sp. DWR1-3-2b1]|uniref:protein kinase domain-containing protein n=1 Tax=Caulobacter sp. DWR1-3-2b1 TaxID=2804670 RepID=UPI003CEC2BC8
MTFLQREAPLRLTVDGFRKPLRLRPLRREGALETFAVEGEVLEAVRFAPAGAVREVGGRFTAIPEAADLYAAALEAFETLGRRLQTTAPCAALRIEAVARTADGCFWLQSPVGLTLEAWLAKHRGAVAEPVVAAFARRLAEALEELHAVGVVHGDLSPRSVLIDGGEVRLTGFMVDRRPLFRVLRSQGGLVEPGYAPPEAHDGALRHPIGPAADLYAASALLQRLLTGRAPPAANLAARVAGDNTWPNGAVVSAVLRVGIDAGLAPAATARPASAAAWLAGLDLGPEPEGAPWFNGIAKTPPPSPPPESETDTLVVPPLPPTERDPIETAPEDAEAPLILGREVPARRRLGWWVGALGLVAVAATAAVVAPKLDYRPQTPTGAGAPTTAPAAPAGCQWLSAPGGWRLHCADTSAQGLSLPERFDAQTTARAVAGEPAAMERLGAFYRQRAGETANKDRGAYAYQALAWLQRAAAAADDGRSDTARARDDAALALGQMLARGEGGRAPDPTAAETRLRQAAAGSRADAVLALGQFLESQAGGDPDRLAEARGLYARVAQLRDASVLQREGERGLARIDAAAKPPPVAIAPPTPVDARSDKPVERAVEKVLPERKAVASKAEPSPIKARVGTGPKPTTAKAGPSKRPTPVAPTQSKLAKARVGTSAKQPAVNAKPPKRVSPVVRTPPKSATTPPLRALPAARAPAPTPALRTWTASAFVKVDPAADFYSMVDLAGRAACESEGGETLSVRSGDTICPNGVNYCQVRAVATCQGARP